MTSLPFCLVLAGVMLAVPAAKQSTLLEVLSRAGDYVAHFERDLATIVAEEDYTQEVRDAGPAEHRELKSDLLLVRGAGTHRYVQLREVFELDGRTVHNRDERLLKFAADPSSVSTGQIAAESARYNIGGIERTINVPVLPLTLLLPDNQWRFKFKVRMLAGRQATETDLPSSPHFTISTEVWVIEYREVERRTLIRSLQGGKDVPAHGRFWVEPASGRVLMAELVAEDGSVHSKIAVSFQSEPILGLFVPIEMRETYWRTNDAIRIEGTATYSNFRRLDVQK